MHKAKITELNLIPNSIHDNNKHHVCMARRGLQILRYSSSYMYFNGDLTSIEYKCLICWIRFLIFKSCFSLPWQVTLNPWSGYSLRYSNDISLTGTMCHYSMEMFYTGSFIKFKTNSERMKFLWKPPNCNVANIYHAGWMWWVPPSFISILGGRLVLLLMYAEIH